jgi:hypothetical protein
MRNSFVTALLSTLIRYAGRREGAERTVCPQQRLLEGCVQYSQPGNEDGGGGYGDGLLGNLLPGASA